MRALDSKQHDLPQAVKCDALARELDRLEAEWIAAHPQCRPEHASWSAEVGDAMDHYRAAVRERNEAIKIPKLKKWQLFLQIEAVEKSIAALELDLEIGITENLRAMVDMQEALRLAERTLRALCEQRMTIWNSEIDPYQRRAERAAGIVRRFPRRRPSVRSVPYE